MATITEPLITKEEFERLPGAFERYEVVDGHLVEVAPMGNVEAMLATRIMLAIGVHLNDPSPTELLPSEARYRLRRDPDLIRGCDVGYVPKDRMPGGRPTSPVGDYVPAQVVEVVSQSNSAAEIARKTNEWFEAGAKLLWVVYPELRQVNVYESARECRILHLGESLDGGSVLPEFRLKLETLFA